MYAKSGPLFPVIRSIENSVVDENVDPEEGVMDIVPDEVKLVHQLHYFL